MATYKTILCPKCKKSIYSANVSSSYTNTTVASCIHCRIRVKIEYGQGKAKTSII